ncbi:MAG TPA: hypothetical protein ENN77_00450 [Candidatus Wirthbacteria bacterium]|nr:hypothetical protein [Candidatus Wirthbacteria bacterium]
MGWSVVGMIVFWSAVIFYLFIRFSQKQNTPDQLINLATFLIPCLLIGAIALFRNLDLSIKSKELTLIFIAAFGLSYLGSVLSLLSQKKAPNPGYSLLVSKCYVVYTTLISVWLFDASLNYRRLGGIFLILFFSAWILIEKSQQKTSGWLFPALGAFAAWGNLALFNKYMLNRGIPALILLFYLLLFVSLFILIEIILNKNNIFLKQKQLWVLMAIGLCSFFFNYYYLVGFDVSPNIGYMNAINTSATAAVAFFSFLIFKDELTTQKIIGIIGTSAGLFMLLL